MNERFKQNTYSGEHEGSRQGYENDDNDKEKQLLLKNDVIESSKNTTEILKILSEVNGEMLENIFKEEIGRSGRNIEDTNFRPVSEVTVGPLTKAHGTYSQNQNLITINNDGEAKKKLLDKTGLETKISPESFLKLKVLHTLCHEETHAVGHNKCEVTDVSLTMTSGYEIFKADITEDNGEKSLSFAALNEGVTELISHRVLNKYLHRDLPKDISQDDVKEFLFLIKRDGMNSHALDLYAVKLFIAFIARSSNTPEEIVENALIRGYLRGSDFITDDMLLVMDEILGKNLGTQLKKSAVDDTESLIKVIEQSDIKIDLKVQLRLLEELIDD